MRSNGQPLRTMAAALFGSGLLLAAALYLRNLEVHDAAAGPVAGPGATAGVRSKLQQHHGASRVARAHKPAVTASRPSAPALATRAARLAGSTEPTLPPAVSMAAEGPTVLAAFSADAFALPQWVGGGPLPLTTQPALPASTGPAPFPPAAPTPAASGGNSGQPFSLIPFFPVPGGGGPSGGGPIFYFPGGPGNPVGDAFGPGSATQLRMAPVPEPAAWLLLLSGIVAMALVVTRSRLAHLRPQSLEPSLRDRETRSRSTPFSVTDLLLPH